MSRSGAPRTPRRASNPSSPPTEIPEPYNNLAVIEAGFGNLEEAQGLLKKALVINPKFSLAQKNLGDVYLALALECYEAAAPALESNADLQSRLRTLKRISGR